MMIDLHAAAAVLCLALAAPLARGATPAANSSHPESTDISGEVDAFIRLRMERERIPGLSLAVVKAGKVIKADGYGMANLELGVPATPSTVYQIGSVTKQFTAAAIMLLVQSNKVSLDGKISEYLDGAPASWKDITVRQLLTHTSGLPTNGISTTDKTFLADYTNDEILESARTLPLLSPPGEQFSYSNLGFDLLALIVEKASGEKYADFVGSRLFEPLEMTATNVSDKQAITPNRAQGYLWEDGNRRICEQLSPTQFMGSASIVSTALDLAKWDAALSTEIPLTDASRTTMWTPTKLADGKDTNYGFGWFISSVKNHTNINHNGAMNGFVANVSRFVDDQLTVIVLVNQSGISNTEKIATGVARFYIPAIRPGQPPTQPSRMNIDPAVLTALAGRYEFFNNVILTLRPGEGMLLGQMPGSEADEYLPLSANAFWQMDEGTQLTAIRNPVGEVTGLLVRHDGGWEHKVPRLGPLFQSLTPQPDPDPTLTQTITAVLKAMGQGRQAFEQAPSIAPGLKKEFSPPYTSFVGLQSLRFLASEDVAERGIERHGAKVSRILFYKFTTDKDTRNVMVYLTADGMVTDHDVVED
jgi:CubicO group peptidase (beta-lactamase class C family)